MPLNREQLQEAMKKASQHARQQAKERGASIYYMKDNKRFREDALGNIFEIVYDTNGQRKEYTYEE
ncbi:hypothetical protein ACE3MZ_00855 [Paenibacillus sp. WLX1005]|uniref:hypothetical protein n=1 Tax=unclassified Paenibacillus TaxID=185978 RepID=UPI0039845FBA